MVGLDETDLAGLREQPFRLLAEMDRRLQARISDLGGSNLGDDAWVGLNFRFGDKQYLAPQAEVREVITPPLFSRVPNAKPWLLGVANARGSLLPLIDLRLLLDGEPSTIQRGSRFMVVNSDEIPAGFLVDGVTGYRRFASAEQRHDLASKEASHWQEFLLGSFVREQQPYLVFSFMKLALADIFQNASA
ncbi:MAG: chemotaxis protein CheW [Oceanococcus sp.]